MGEPTLENIEDYQSLGGEKRRIVWAVVLAGLIIGGIYAAAKIAYGSVSDEHPVQEKAGLVPYK